MPTGTPLWPACPKCRRGAYGHAGRKNTVVAGALEIAVRSSGHKGHGNGGPFFRGHRALMRCEDCNHTWWSTNPAAYPLRLWEKEKMALRCASHQGMAARGHSS